jgi:integrase
VASLRKFPRSPFWFACFTLPDGRRVQRSTKEVTRKAAQTKADQWEALTKERAKARQAHRVISEIYRVTHNRELPDSTTRAFIDRWLASRKHEIAPSSYVAYSGRATHFVEWLGEIADRPLGELETRHFVLYRDAVASTRTARTANHGIKILRAIFESARRDGFISENPAKDCGPLKESAGSVRRPFTVKELRDVLAIADAEWRSLILFGIYTGQRIGDLSRLTWAHLDLEAQEISIRTQKTGRVVRIPICAPLLAHISTLPAGEDARAPIHPRALGIVQTARGTLSRQFGELLSDVGLVQARSHQATKSGRSGRRVQSQLSFHSLRHMATSLMKNAGVSPAIVQDIIGHESAEISAHYTHVESAAKRDALSKLPDLVKQAKPRSKAPKKARKK